MWFNETAVMLERLDGQTGVTGTPRLIIHAKLFEIICTLWTLVVVAFPAAAAALDGSLYFIFWRLHMASFAIFVTSMAIFMLYAVSKMIAIFNMVKTADRRMDKTFRYKMLRIVLVPFAVVFVGMEVFYTVVPDTVDSSIVLWSIFQLSFGQGTSLPVYVLALWVSQHAPVVDSSSGKGSQSRDSGASVSSLSVATSSVSTLKADAIHQLSV